MKPRSQWNWLLWPFGVIYAGAARARIWGYQRGVFRTRTLPGTVISVGNLTVGGTGKTPMVIWLAEQLAAEGKHPAILTRGYRGTNHGEASAEPQSDEVALFRSRLNGKVQLGVGADRFKSGEILARHAVDCFILDDGFQHVKLSRDVNIVLVDATDPFGGGRVLPAGRLREPISALRRADIVVITRAADSPIPAIETMIRRNTVCPIFYAKTKFDGLFQLPDLSAVSPSDASARKYFAFCAIGNPAAFFSDLARWGVNLVSEQRFPDHHSYDQKEFDGLIASAKKQGAHALLCTEKDIWNLRNVKLGAMPVFCCRISMDFPTPGFRDAIAGVLHTAPPHAGIGEPR